MIRSGKVLQLESPHWQEPRRGDYWTSMRLAGGWHPQATGAGALAVLEGLLQLPLAPKEPNTSELILQVGELRMCLSRRVLE